MKIMSGAVVMVLLYSGSFALAAEPSYVPGNGLMFPDSVERAMIGEGAWASEIRGFGVLEISQSSFGFVPGALVPVEPHRAPLTSSEAEDDMQKALRLFRERKFDETAASLRDAARVNPRLPSEYVMMYGLFTSAGQPKAARSWLEEAIVKTPKDPEPWAIFGQLALKDKRIAEGELDFAKAKELLGAYMNAHRKQALESAVLREMAKVKEHREQFAEAQALLEEYLRHSADDVDAWLELARVIFWQRKVDEAYKELQKAKNIDLANVKKDPTGKSREQMLPAAAILAQYYDDYERNLNYHYHESAQAKKWFKYALKQAPNDMDLRAAIGEWALENNEMELAKELAKESRRIELEDINRPFVRRMGARSTIGLMLSGKVALWQKSWAEADTCFQMVLDEQPNNFDAKNSRALALVEQDDPQKKQRALNYAEADLHARPDDPSALATLAWVRYRRGELDLAAEVIEKAVKAAGLDAPAEDAEHFDPDEVDRLLMSGIGKGPRFFSQPIAVKLRDLEIHTIMAYVFDAQGRKQQAKAVLKALLDDGQPFSIKPEAEALYKKLKDVKAP